MSYGIAWVNQICKGPVLAGMAQHLKYLSMRSCLIEILGQRLWFVQHQLAKTPILRESLFGYPMVTGPAGWNLYQGPVHATLKHNVLVPAKKRVTCPSLACMCLDRYCPMIASRFFNCSLPWWNLLYMYFRHWILHQTSESRSGSFWEPILLESVRRRGSL